ncbi:MAG TPA: biopolymer transporter ExbD [Terriglobales bacterium]|nr:biopolymer transporter ExbD [Terriglobales bacterium]
MRQGNSRSSRLIRRIDVSALAAVLFVLLFLFMMLTAIPHDGVSADLPKVWHSTSMPGARREDAIVVSILRDGTIYFGNDKTRPGDLPPQILKRIGNRAEKKVYIRADSRLRYGTVCQVLDAIHSAGVEKIAFFVYQRSAASAGDTGSQ